MPWLSTQNAKNEKNKTILSGFPPGGFHNFYKEMPVDRKLQKGEKMQKVKWF